MQGKMQRNMQSGKSDFYIRWLICLVAVTLIFIAMTGFAAAETKTGTVATTALNIRSGPGSNYSSLGLISINKEVTILDETYDVNGDKWYLVISPAGNRGYVSARYVVVNSENEYVHDSDFEESLSAEGFPESYKPYLRDLHARYPMWVFKAAHTDLDWSAVISRESKPGTSLVASGSPSSWKSTAPGAYDSENGKYIEYDSGGWVSASEEIVAYYMDPRNFINPVGMFQFLTHSYDPSTQTKAGLAKVLSGSFMSGAFPESTHDTYADVLMEAGQISGVNPYVLASMILVEQGSSGKGGCISGTVSGYEGYYNFFNIGAYKSGSMSAVTRGVWYASQSGSYGRPWDSRYKSIVGGAKFYASQYVQQNKNTLYFKKFNVMNGQSSVGTGQYMTNVQGAESEAAALRNGYVDSLDDPMTFIIPVYKNMPNNTCPIPGSNTDPQPEQKPEPEPKPEKPDYVRGDVNDDGKIDEDDALAIQKHITDKSLLKGVSLEAADVNGDGRVNSLDVLFIKKHIEGKYSISD